MRAPLFLVFSLFACLVSAQADPENRQVMVLHSEPAGLAITEPVARGMSLYAISQHYGVGVEAILAANPDLDPRAVPLGYPLAIPLDPSNITQQTPRLDQPAIPLSYRIQPRETLYRIAKVYLGSTPEAVLALNPNATETLSIGQVLHIGWYLPATDPAPPVATPDTTLAVSDTGIRDYAAEYALAGAEIREQKGLAIWRPGSAEGHYFVLHPTARIGSYMEVTNPMLHRTLTAKVAGQLNPDLYPKNVGLVVSPSLAKALGVLDQQFFARWRFIE